MTEQQSVRPGKMSLRKTGTLTSNAVANRAALKQMTVLERECGITAEEYDRQHAAMRARVRARYGLKAAA